MTDHPKVLADRTAAYREAQDQLAKRRVALQDAMREASADGMKQSEIIRAADNVWTREQVRQVLLAKSATSPADDSSPDR